MAPSTKLALAGSLKKLLQKKFLDDITVKELVEDCQVNRQTFYYHFRDIVDVMEWKARREMERLLPEHLKASSPREAMGRFVDFAVDAQPVVRRLLASQRRETIERILLESVRSYLEESAREWGVEPPLDPADWKITLDFYACGVAGVLLESCRRREPDRQQLADQLFRLLGGEMFRRTGH